MSDDIQTLVLNYIREEVFEDELGKIIQQGVHDIQHNIRYGPHTGLTSYERGDLYGSADGYIQSVSDLTAVLVFYTDTSYDVFQDQGTYDKSEEGKGIAPREFMKYGIEDLIKNYGG